jgi:hypothetical protein
MPPWGADPAHGKFSNDPTLAADEVTIISEWTSAGAPEGDPSQGPKPIHFLEGWNIEPEVVSEMPVAYTIPATGTIDYTYFVVPTHFQEDRWIQMAEVRPGNRSVVHHVIVYVRQPGSTWLKDAIPGQPYIPPKGMKASEFGEYLVGYTPGKQAMQLPPGQAKLLRAGSDLVFQMHYTGTGKETTDRTRVGFVFASKPPVERVYTYGIMNRDLVIPPQTADHAARSEVTFVSDARVVTYWPHMHLRGKSMRFESRNPAGERQTLLNVPKYDFNWQLRYIPAQPLKVGPGSIIECLATFDNSRNNPFNPNPDIEVRWGDQSWEEMMVGFIDIAFDARKSPLDVVRRPQPKLVTTAGK